MSRTRVTSRIFRSARPSGPIGTSRKSWARTVGVIALGPVLAVSLVACGGGSSTGTVAGATPNASATGAPGQGGGQGRGGFGGADFTKIQACLTAAGITLPTPNGSNFPRPSGSFVRPSGTAYPRPSGSGGPGQGGGGGFRGQFASAEVQASLKACGITIPTGRPAGAGAPTATPTS